MAEVSAVLPAYTESDAFINWEDLAGLADIDDLSEPGANLVRLRLRSDNGRVAIRTNIPPAAPQFAGPDLNEDWEGNESAITLQVAGLPDLVLSGPAHGDSADSSEPYSWGPTTDYVGGIAAWRTALQALAEDAQVVTLVLSDGAGNAVLHDAAVASIVFGAPTLAAAAEAVDAVVHDAAVAPIAFGAPTLAAAAETVGAADATVAPITFGVPSLAAAARIDPAGVPVDAAVAPILFGAPTLAAAGAESVPAPAFEGLLAPDGDRVLTGSSAAAQRLADALRIQRGSYPFLRDYGSTLALLVDRRPAAAFAAVAEALIHPANGLDDIRLRAVRVSPAGAGAVVVEVDAEWRPAPAAASTPISIREQLQPAP